jgi:serine/threonine-protein kinase
MPEIDALNAALPGEIELSRVIYVGGQRSVYEASVEGERRVLKLMAVTDRERTEREVSTAKGFDHPNLSRILDEELGEVTVDGEDYVYFTEQFVEGETLAERTAPMDACEALTLAEQLISAVTYLWEQHHIVHRDIKPLNIMVKPDGTCVLLDIGVARHQDLTTLTNVAADHQPGTLGYLAPEQLAPLKGREIDFRADLFAIGIVVYQQISGKLPFEPSGNSYRTLLTSGLAPELDGVDAPLASLLARLLAAKPHGRFRLDKAAAAVAQAKDDLECS